MQNLKRIASGALGALMAGSTMLSPVLAAGLEDFSTFTTANSLIVVGADAATADVVGGINIGAAVARHGATAKTTTTGPSSTEGAEVSVTTSADLLEVNESIGDPRQAITGAQWNLLKSYTLTNDKGNTKVNQFLRLNNATDDTTGRVTFGENKDGDVTADYLYFKEGQVIFEYEMEFEEGWQSDIDSSKILNDIEDQTVTILGKDFQVVTAKTNDTDTDALSAELTLISGAVKGSLAEGEKQTYTYGGKPYEVAVTFISNPNSGTAKTILSVNGKNSKELSDGETTTVDGITVGISNLLVNDRGGVVSFFLGANKVFFKTTDVTDGDFSSGSLEVNSENIEDALVKITGSVSAGPVMKITNLKYQLKADAKVSSNVFIPSGGKLSAQLDEAAGMLHEGWDFEYRGLMNTGVSVLKFSPSGDDEYNLQFTTGEGLEYNIDLLESDGAGGFKIGDADDDLHWYEVLNVTGNWATATAGDITERPIAEDNYFILTNSKGGREGGDDTSFTHVLRYDSLDTTDKKVTFTDLATGAREITYKADDTTSTTDMPQYTPTGGSAAEVNASGWSDTLIVGGTTYRVYLENVTGTTRKLAIDLNGDNTFNFDLLGGGYNVTGESQKADIVIKGGGILVMPTNDSNGRPGSAGALKFNLTTLSKNTDEQSGNEGVEVNITNSTSTVDIDVVNPTGVFARNTIQTIKQKSDFKQGLSKYGVWVEEYSPSSTTTADSVTIEYPLAQRGANVYLIGAAAAATSVAGSENVQFTELGSSVTKLDTEATTSDKTGKNLILVGGPAVNTLVAELGTAGKTLTLDEWRTDANVGRAIVQFIGDAWGKPAIVVAGYSADDTRKASFALASTALTGMGQSWIGTTQSAWTYTKPAAATTTTTTTTTTPTA